MKFFAEKSGETLTPEQKEERREQRREQRREVTKSRAFRSGGYAAAVSAVAIALVVAFNILVGALPKSLTAFDLTGSGMYDLDEQTELILDALDTDITAYFLAPEGSEDSRISNLLGRYAAYSEHIKINQVDPVRNPAFIKKYTDEDVNSNSVIFECGDKSAVVDYSDIYKTETSYAAEGSYTNSTFNGQDVFTGAIDRVTSDDLPVLYALTGHGETDVTGDLASAIAGDNFELKELSLLTVDAVPDDADCLLVYSPVNDLSADDAAKLKDYMEASGRLLLITDYPQSGRENLMGLMEYYGMAYQDGIVMEANEQYCVSGYPYYLLPELLTHEVTEPQLKAGLLVVTPACHGIAESESPREYVEVTPLLTTSSSGYLKAAGTAMTTAAMEEGDTPGPINVAVASQADYFDADNEPVLTRAVWIATGGIADSQMNTVVSGNNFNFILNALGWLTEKESSISIRAVSMDVNALTVTGAWRTVLSVLLMGVIPAALLATGLVVWIKRRKRV